MSRKYDKLIKEMYTLLYKNATPSVDFNTLLENAQTKTIGHQIKKVIPFDDYYLSDEDYEKIIKQLSKKYKLNKKEIEGLRFEAYLGATPSRIKHNKNTNI